MKQWDTVAIVGVGLIGGSIGLALRERQLARTILGIGRRSASLRKAKKRGAVMGTTMDLARGVASADLIVVCTPVADIVARVLEVADACPATALITDVGSTKAAIVGQLDKALNTKGDGRATFVGSHPLAGSEKTGPQSARADLFENRAVIVTPARRTPTSAVALIKSLWESVGATVLTKTPQDHDQSVAAISHLPHLLASALANATPSVDLCLAAGGWLDTTRVAAADAELWRQILADNRLHVLKSLDKFEKVLTKYRLALEKDDQNKLLKLLEAGKLHRESVGN
ncbi:MAG: prephenate dehydrogenase/arogenate dehydrogenase family protein [Pirellulaceae bacterium]|jgi:prephenate dehydrogenase|nr:prephenate dehydrogenase/arogenate dehydrogenase family protein [Pirellulaceae bacterium]MDP6555036.1 prephenate dehydrogenase/arogenate dehydrogenase family protein [Pirellulaceae bacterium]MDP6718712.1 prephenate dehydrogenase/arogenate dehydrogenase family protein [Pirellulaceae bacterium]